MSEGVGKKGAGYHHRMIVSRTVKEIICIVLCLMSLLPFLMLFVNATRDSKAIQAGITLIPSSFLPANWDAFMAKNNGLQITVWRAMINSVLVTVPATLLSVYVSSMTAYGIEVYNFKFKKFAWAFIMAVMLVPNTVASIGFYRFMFDLGWDDNYVPLIVPAAAAPTVVFFMRQYLQGSFSVSLVEAARIDGSGEFSTFNRISVPLMKPAIATQAIFQFVAIWNSLFLPSLILNTDSKKTLPLFISLLQSDQFKTDYGVLYIGLSVTILPMFVAYFLLSRYIVAGVALGGVKE